MIFRSGGIFGEMWNQMMRKEQWSFREAVQFIVITFSFSSHRILIIPCVNLCENLFENEENYSRKEDFLKNVLFFNILIIKEKLLVKFRGC